MRMGLSFGGRLPPGGGPPPPPPLPPGLFGRGHQGFQLDPSDLSSMRIARDGSGPSPQIGDVVGWIADLSGNGHHAAALTDAGRPRLEMVGGKPALRFDGVDDALMMTGVPFGQQVTVYVAAERTGSGVLLGYNRSDDLKLGQLIRFRPAFVSRPYLADGTYGYSSISVGGRIRGRWQMNGPAFGFDLDDGSSAGATFGAGLAGGTTTCLIGDEATTPLRPFDGALFAIAGYTDGLPGPAEDVLAAAWLDEKMGDIA
jgi:hypothetical protein